MAGDSDNDNDNKTDSPVRRSLERGFANIISPFQSFVRDQATASMILIVCTAVALVLANSPLAHWYESLVDTHTGVVFGDWSWEKSLRHWINDGLMSIFFFVLGLEIKREILAGDLKDRERSIPVMAAALGGMLLPAAIYYAFNAGSPGVHGWGIPMATDTAFAVGILALLGKRIPSALTVFLTALAIIDDLGAIMVIAVFYTENISVPHLELAGLLLAVLIVCNAVGIRHPSVYFLVGGLVWLAMLGSGVHATVAGILVAFTTPARPQHGKRWFLRRTRELANELEAIEENARRANSILAEPDQHKVVERVEETAARTTTPLQRWERALTHPVSLFVLPIFALANAGVAIGVDTLPALFDDPVIVGIVLGLLLGKSVGITFACWLALRLGLGRLPGDMQMHHVLGVAMLGGMGFTMSIFIAGLSFGDSPAMLVAAKTAILLASLLSGLGGYLWLRLRG
jgi:NhaA family Na+:H+ antiporter